ncbi:MAG: hypothetical protein AUJ92_19085 [Armatimonadetes bacterium CG2_30_59_28]|nr:MAG: hypothetical protein AUJ92_19085 [Armatimonadetes bacterium CG2_30_59_28]
MSFSIPYEYDDHIQLWANELKDWLPDSLFDAHVHLGPPEVVGEISSERQQTGLTAFTHLILEEINDICASLFDGKRTAGMITFGFPLQEVNIEAANAYTAGLIRKHSHVKGFIFCNPGDVAGMVRDFREWEKAGVRFHGVKPYFDFLRKSNYETDWEELLPTALLEFMNGEELVMMLHTCRTGMGEPRVQEFIGDVVDRYPKIKIVFAHMGRYFRVEPTLKFLESDLLNCPSLHLEMSSATVPEVYERVLSRRELWDRLLFGTDLPFGLWTGVEQWSQATGPVFVTRNTAVTHPAWLRRFGIDPDRLTYNTYHVVKAVKDAMGKLRLDEVQSRALREKVFLSNAQRLFEQGCDDRSE